MRPPRLVLLAAGLLAAGSASALLKPEITYQIFQFPADRIPRIDGDTADWAIVPDSYAIGCDQMTDDKQRHPTPDPQNLEFRVRIGWVQGLNRLYFLYEAYDDYWDFSLPTLHNDTFEVIVDGDASGGPLIPKGEPRFWTREHLGEAAALPDDRLTTDAARWSIHGVHAQNYHIFTPPGDKEWAMAWGAPTWVKDFPWANSVCRFDGRPGGPGHLVLEFWITPFDYAGPEGPQRAVESVLREGKIIGLGLIVMDYDDVAKNNSSAFWNLSPKHSAYGDASELCAFRLMPLEPALQQAGKVRWSWLPVDSGRHTVAFRGDSPAPVSTWHWDFGDGATSSEQNPVHTYAAPGGYTVTLEVAGPAGTARLTKLGEVQLP